MTNLPRELKQSRQQKIMLVLCLVTVLVGDVLVVVIQNWVYRCPEECSLVGDVLVVIHNWGYRCPEECSLVGCPVVVIQNWGYRCPEECSLVGCPCCCDTKLGLGVLRNVSLLGVLVVVIKNWG